MIPKKLKEKVSDFIKKHGLTMKAYWIAVLILSPAAFYIVYKMPEWNRPQRGLAYTFIVFFMAVIPFVGHAVITTIIDFFKPLFS